jgi:hypothetical protein
MEQEYLLGLVYKGVFVLVLLHVGALVSLMYARALSTRWLGVNSISKYSLSCMYSLTLTLVRHTGYIVFLLGMKRD